MTFHYQIPEENKMQNKGQVEAAVNEAIADIEKADFDKMSAAELVDWINRWYLRATYKHLIKALLAWAREAGKL